MEMGSVGRLFRPGNCRSFRDLTGGIGLVVVLRAMCGSRVLLGPDIYADAPTEFGPDKPHWLSSLQGEGRAAFLAGVGSSPINLA